MWTYALVGLLLLLWLLYRKQCFSELETLGVPGPKPNLIFGNLWDLAFKTPLVCHSEWLKKYGNIVGYYFGTKPVVLIADLDILKRVQVAEFHKFINRPNIARSNPQNNKRVEGFSQHLISLRDKRWKEIRSIITPSFTASKMKQMAPIMNGAIDSLVNNVEKKCKTGESFDIYPMYQGLTMDVIGRTAFGIQTDVQNNPQDPFLRSARVLFSGDIKSLMLVVAASFRSLPEVWTRLNRIRLRFNNKGTNPVDELVQSVKDVIATRRRNKEARRPDLLQIMMDAEVDEGSVISSDDLTAKDDNTDETKKESTSSSKMVRKMTDADILDNSVLFFLAGYETTSTALAFITHFLVHYPEVQEKIRTEVKSLLQSEKELDYYSVNKLQYLDQVLHESLRLYPPIYLFVSRECGEDVVLGDIRIPKGYAVQVPTFQIQRDPEIWGEDAHLFKPERFSPENKSKVSPFAFQVFGAGPRNCVGMRFATMEAKLAIATLLSRYRFEKCPETDKEDITLKVSAATINPKHGIWLRALPLD